MRERDIRKESLLSRTHLQPAMRADVHDDLILRQSFVETQPQSRTPPHPRNDSKMISYIEFESHQAKRALNKTNPNKPLDTKISRTYNMNTQEIHRNLPRSFPAADDSQFHNKCLSTLIRNSPNTARSRPRFARCDVQSAHAPLPGQCVSRPTVGELLTQFTPKSLSANRRPPTKGPISPRSGNHSTSLKGDQWTNHGKFMDICL